MVLDSVELLLTPALLNRRTVMKSFFEGSAFRPKVYSSPLFPRRLDNQEAALYSPELTLTLGVASHCNSPVKCDES